MSEDNPDFGVICGMQKAKCRGKPLRSQ
jgi:hypothetical protein